MKLGYLLISGEGKNTLCTLPAEYTQYAKTHSDSDYGNIWTAVYTMYTLFHTLALIVADNFGFTYRQDEEDGIREYLLMVKGDETHEHRKIHR